MAVERIPLRFSDKQIEMAHGAGGRSSRRLVEQLIVPLLRNPLLEPLGDAAFCDINGISTAFTVDTFVVRPLSFPGGCIGKLAVNGTVNDLAVSGAKPQALMVTFVLEAGLPVSVLQDQVEALAEAAEQAGVHIVGGDTKVVEHGKADGLYVTTAGIGEVDPRVRLAAGEVRAGDQILLSGPIGDHGITILLARGELDLESDLMSDTRPVTPLVQALVEAAAPGLRWMRDPTRGGVASALNELVSECGLAALLDESSIPLREPVRGACEILGLDPLHIANEGQFLAIVAPEFGEQGLDALRRTSGGEGAARIGEICQAPRGKVLCVTPYGGKRVVNMLVGDPLPRIC